jgi:hypothetical protein
VGLWTTKGGVPEGKTLLRCHKVRPGATSTLIHSRSRGHTRPHRMPWTHQWRWRIVQRGKAGIRLQCSTYQGCAQDTTTSITTRAQAHTHTLSLSLSLSLSHTQAHEECHGSNLQPSVFFPPLPPPPTRTGCFLQLGPCTFQKQTRNHRPASLTQGLIEEQPPTGGLGVVAFQGRGGGTGALGAVLGGLGAGQRNGQQSCAPRTKET